MSKVLNEKAKQPLIIISGYYGFDNLGDEAILEELISELERQVPKKQIIVLSANPEITKQKFGVEAIYRTNLLKLFFLMSKTRLLISGGGGLFQDIKSIASVVFYSLPIWTAKIFGVKVLIYAQGIGPLHSKWGQAITRQTFSMADNISVRDQASYDLLALWGQAAQLTADPVWCLESKPMPETVSIRKSNNTILIGLSLRQSHNFSQSHMQMLVEVLAETLPKEACLVLLPLQNEEDKPLLQSFEHAWQLKGRNSFLFNPQGLKLPSQWLTLFKELDFLIAMRLHALIMALKEGIACLGIAYDPKVSQLLTSFEQPTLILSNEVTKETQKEEWIKLVKQVLADKERLSATAKLKVEQTQKIACQNNNLISRMLDMPSSLLITNRLRQTVLGYPVDIVDEPTALEIIESAWRQERRLQIVTLNAEMVVAAQQDKELDRIIRHAHLIIPDGAGVVWALKLAGQNIDRLAGIDLAEAALHRAANAGRKIALIGGSHEVCESVAKMLPLKHPGLKITGYHHGYYKPEDEEAIVSKIAANNPELVLVAMGVPKQEYFIERVQKDFPKAVIMGVGGSFDVWAGNAKRAPKVMRNLHLEWLYRLISEPWRSKRIGSALPNFGWQVVREFLSKQNIDKSSKQ